MVRLRSPQIVLREIFYTFKIPSTSLKDMDSVAATRPYDGCVNDECFVFRLKIGSIPYKYMRIYL